MSKRAYEKDIVNNRPKKITAAQQKKAIETFGFINGGRFLRSPKVQAVYGNSGYRSNRAEVKGVDNQIDYTPVIATTSTNAGIFVMNLVQQGNGSWNRVGKKIRLKSLRLKGFATFTNLTSMPVLQNAVRIIVVWDKQPSGNAIPNFDAIIGGTDQSGTESSGFMWNVRYDNTERFSILKDEVMTSDINVLVSGATATSQVCFDTFIKLKNLVTIFSGQSAPMTIADISTGGLYVCIRAQAQNASQTVAIVNSSTRLRYYDN